MEKHKLALGLLALILSVSLFTMACVDQKSPPAAPASSVTKGSEQTSGSNLTNPVEPAPSASNLSTPDRIQNKSGSAFPNKTESDRNPSDQIQEEKNNSKSEESAAPNAQANASGLDTLMNCPADTQIMLKEQKECRIGNWTIEVAGFGGFSGSWPDAILLIRDESGMLINSDKTNVGGLALTPGINYTLVRQPDMKSIQVEILVSTGIEPGSNGWITFKYRENGRYSGTYDKTHLLLNPTPKKLVAPCDLSTKPEYTLIGSTYRPVGAYEVRGAIQNAEAVYFPENGSSFTRRYARMDIQKGTVQVGNGIEADIGQEGGFFDSTQNHQIEQIAACEFVPSELWVRIQEAG